MNTSTILLIGTAVPTVCYACVAAAFILEGKPWNAMTWFGYAFANVGLMKVSGII
mgnify:CR=1|tara:strand:- start:3832 stop:3996 length:165 start_codon:yes stop_codon:yes gene_type:complete